VKYRHPVGYLSWGRMAGLFLAGHTTTVLNVSAIQGQRTIRYM